MGEAESRDIIDLGPGLLTAEPAGRIDPSSWSTGYPDGHAFWLDRIWDRLLKKAGVQHYVFTAYTLAQEYG